METSRIKRLAEGWVGKSLNGWTVGDYINCGKSALVFKARKNDTEAAIKIFDPEIVERFGRADEEQRIQRELTVVGSHHPNLISIYDGGHSTDPDLYFVVMELIDSPNLGSVLKAVPSGQIRLLISQIAAAARFLEDKGIVHRDIKPDNICVSADFQQATLLDLGVIRPSGAVSDPPLTDREEQLFIGTLQYASPEFLIRTEEHTLEGSRALTFYQLGAVLYDILEKKRIFSESASPFARLVQAILHDNPKIDSNGKAPDLVNLANNCLVKNPRVRLSIVAWDDFDQNTRTIDGVTQAKENIRKRSVRALFETQSSESVSSYDEARRRKQISSELLSKIAEQVRAMSDESDLPPRTVKEIPEDEPKGSLLVTRFKASVKFGLLVDFHLVLRLQLLDVNAQVIELHAAAAGSNREIDEGFFQSHFSTIFHGVYEDAVIRPALENALFPALEKAMDMTPTASVTPISIIVEPKP